MKDVESNHRFRWNSLPLSVRCESEREDLRSAAPPDPLAANAALHYWRAISLTPDIHDKREAILRDAVEKLGPVDEKTAEVIGLRKLALRELHRGAAYPRCVWATPLDERAEVLLPCYRAGQLARFAWCPSPSDF